MRVVLIAGPDAGHAFPVMALAERFRSAGDEAVVLTGERWWQAGRAAGLDVRRRSVERAPDARCAVFLIDSLGELPGFLAAGDVAFVGGSLCDIGGHNLLEPAALGMPVLSGPHLFNFLEIAAQLREAGALLEVNDAEELARRLAQLYSLPRDAERMADAGLAVLRANQGALQKLLDGLERLLARAQPSA